MRTVPWLVHACFGENGEPLRAAARSPHRQRAYLQNFGGASPRLAIHLAPIFEIARQKRAERTRLGADKRRIKFTKPHLLRLQVFPAVA
jgi:hypothetical protein